MQSAQFRLHAELEEHHWWFRGRREILRTLVHHLLPSSAGRVVVDVGCGTGANLAPLASAYHCLGIDHSTEAIQIAQSRFPGVEFLCSSIPIDLEVTTTSPRLFLLMDVLEHVPDDKAFLVQLLGMMVPGDLLLLTVPADMSLWSIHDVSYGHYRRYNLAGLEETWADLPVERLFTSFFNARLYLLVKAARYLSRWRHQPWGVAGTDLRVPPYLINWLLERIFSGESHRLVALLKDRHPRGYVRGVSLIALLRRSSGGAGRRCPPPG